MGHGRSAEEITVGYRSAILVGQRIGTFVVYRLQFIAKNCFKGFRNDIPLAVHANRVGLQHNDAIIHIQDQTRAAIAFAMNKPVAVGIAGNNCLPDAPDVSQFFRPVR